MRDIPLLESSLRLKVNKEQQEPTLGVHFGRIPSYQERMFSLGPIRGTIKR